MKQLPILDALRGAAIILVFLYHALMASFGPQRVEWNGIFLKSFDLRAVLGSMQMIYGSAIGVAVFFVVSGFCIHLSYAKSAASGFKVFFIRRFFRIYPPYGLCLVLLIVASFWSTRAIGGSERALQFWTHALMIHNAADKTFFGVNPSFWSIAIEVQLYALYPLLVWLSLQQGWKRSLVATAVVELALRAGTAAYAISHPGAPVPFIVTTSPFVFWFTWTLGAQLADAYLVGSVIKVPALRMVVTGAAIVGSAFVAPLLFFLFPLTALFTRDLIALQIPRSTGKPNRITASLGAIGLVSYSFYLIHQPLLTLAARIVQRFAPGLSSPSAFALYLFLFVPIYFAAGAFYRWVELPSIALGKSVLGGRRAAPVIGRA